MKKARLAILMFLTIAGLLAPARADEDDSGGPEPNVARISLIHGDVSMQRGDTGDWEAVTINAPLVRGDQVATGDKSRTEVQLDFADVVRLAAKSQIKIADLTRTHIQIQVAQGYASYTAFKGGEADVEIDTPNVAVRPLKPGRYRVQVISDGETEVIIRDGEAQVTTPQGSTTVKEGQLITIRGTDNPEYKIADAPGKDDWDQWNKERDNVIREAEGNRRTNQYYTGAQDLDTYGHWVYVDGYGSVWAPYRQGPDWAPYHDGRWVWEPYYGWTWVSYEPWGWAPYHYGRWFFTAGSWYWWPGPVTPVFRPVWSPAYVFFIGFGHHATFGFGSIGWLPVGPCDPFFPWFGRGFNRVNVVNITNINVINVNRRGFIAPLRTRGFSNINLAVTNVRVRNAVTTVPVEDFNRGVMTRSRRGVDVASLRGGRFMTANLPVVPTRESLQPGRLGARPAVTGGAGRTDEHFFARRQPPAAPPAFQRQADDVQRVVRGRGSEAELTTHAGATAGSGGRVSAGADNNARISDRDGSRPGTGGRPGMSTDGRSSPADLPANKHIGGEDAGMTRGNAGNSDRGNSDGWRGFGRSGNDGRNSQGASSPSDLPANRKSGDEPGQGRNPGATNNDQRGDRDGFRGFNRGDGGRSPQGASSPSDLPANRRTGGDGETHTQQSTDQPSGARPVDRTGGGWGRFSPQPGEPAHMDRSGNSGGGGDQPSGGRRGSDNAGQSDSPHMDRSRNSGGGGDQPSGGRRGSDNPGQSESPHMDRGGNSGSGRNPGRGDSPSMDRGGSKPPLQLNKPIVTPRSEPRGGGGGGRQSSPPSRGSSGRGEGGGGRSGGGQSNHSESRGNHK